MSASENEIFDTGSVQDMPDSSSQYIYENSGHRMFCPKCQTFRRTKSELQQDLTTLRVTCKKCDAYSDFVLRRDGLVPKWFADVTRQFAKARAREFLREEAGKDASS